MEGERLTIYLVLGSLQARATRELLRYAAGDSLVINGSPSPIPSRASVMVRTLGSTASVESAIDYWRLARQLKALQRSYGKISVAVPHIYHLIANHLYYEVCNDEVLLLPDGTLTLTPMKVRSEQRRKMLFRSALAPFLGLRYRSFQGSLHGFDRKVVDRVVTFFDSPYLPAHRTIQKLDLSLALPVAAGTCLVVDQPMEQAVVSRQDVDDIAKAIAARAANFTRRYVKLHPRQLGPSIARHTRDAVMLDRTIAAEDLFTDFAPEVIIGTASTALITLKSLFPETAVLAVGLNRVETARPEFRDFRAKLVSIGAEFVDV